MLLHSPKQVKFHLWEITFCHVLCPSFTRVNHPTSQFPLYIVPITMTCVKLYIPRPCSHQSILEGSRYLAFISIFTKPSTVLVPKQLWRSDYPNNCKDRLPRSPFTPGFFFKSFPKHFLSLCIMKSYHLKTQYNYSENVSFFLHFQLSIRQ